MAPILINKDVFEPSYNDLKFTVQNCNYFCTNLIEFIIASLVAQMVKNLPAMQETQVRCLGQGDPLEKKVATHFSILGWRIQNSCQGQRSLVGYSPQGRKHD